MSRAFGTTTQQHGSRAGHRHPAHAYGQLAPKILVATLNVRQRTNQRLLRDAESADPKFQRAMAAYQRAGVKNLENLQGDECDILIISVGYGSNPGGRFSRNYGVINKRHGYRFSTCW